MGRQKQLRERSYSRLDHGFTLVELTIAVAMLCLVATIGSASLVRGLQRQEARGAAQTWQAASAWAQVGVLWQGGGGHLSYAGGVVSLSHSASLFGGAMGSVAPPVAADSNLTHWTSDDGVTVSFSGVLASPDGGGSIFFRHSGGSYRVTVRPETGFTTRSWAAGP
jgi:prepilin-type N-terminal cleavage/methylation domain-containing protein